MKFFRTMLIFLLAGCAGLQAQTFADFLARVNAAPLSGRQAIVDSFMNAAPAFPFIEQDTLCHFIYQGNVNRVNVPGDANGWDINGFPMTHIDGTNFWYHREVFESDARLDYKFVLNGSNWILDPLNPNTILGGFGPNSELRMPAYLMPPEIEFYNNIPHGTLVDTSFYSVHLGNARTIRVYLPPGYTTSTDSLPMMLFHDGLEYLSLANSRNVLDYLIDRGSIRPIIGVFIPPVNRTAEYTGNLQGAFTEFIVDEVMPWLSGRFRISGDPHDRATIGSSAGGNISLWLGMTHPEIFGNVAAQSSYIQPSIFDGFQNGPLLDLQIYLNLGTYDLPVLIPLVHDFVPILQGRGYVFQFQEFHEGHSWGLWRAHIDDALEMFFPASPTAVDPVTRVGPSGFHLSQNFPNPFNPSTTVAFFLRRRMVISLKIYDTLGREVAVLVRGPMAAGEHRVIFQADHLAGGNYLLNLQAEGGSQSRLITLLK